MSDFAQPSQSSSGRRRRRIWWLLLLVAVLASAWVWWWGSWRKWDVTITFLRFEEAGDGRTAVFEVVNRSAEDLIVPAHPTELGYKLWWPDGGTTTFAPKSHPFFTLKIRPGSSEQVTIPLLCPNGNPITGPFRLGFEVSDQNRIKQLDALDRKPPWVRHLFNRFFPGIRFSDNVYIYWTETVTP
jgi:hypothetical protein